MDKVEHFLENCDLEDLAEVATGCWKCGGRGYYIDDPSPPGLYMSAGHYTFVCDCIDEDLILDRF
tara:strand:+ start:168 stop:362 length:195 start_codon:yes stop_codon:yes gene_type:complete